MAATPGAFGRKPGLLPILPVQVSWSGAPRMLEAAGWDNPIAPTRHRMKRVTRLAAVTGSVSKPHAQEASIPTASALSLLPGISGVLT